MVAKRKPGKTVVPSQARAKATYEKILKAAQEILAEDGLEALNSNAIVDRAEVSAPLFYRYFKDKYDLLNILGTRLTDAQNEPSGAGLNDNVTEASLEDEIYRLLTETLKVTESFEGALAILVSLRAIPSLASIRIDASLEISKQSVKQLQLIYPDLPKAEALRRSRLTNDLAYAFIEMLMEVPGMPRRRTLRDGARAICAILRG